MEYYVKVPVYRMGAPVIPHDDGTVTQYTLKSKQLRNVPANQRVTMSASDTANNDIYQKFLYIWNLIPNTVKSNVKNYIAAQIMMETGGFTSPRSKNSFNYSGIKYYKGSKGIGKDRSGFAIYKTPYDWLTDYTRELNKNHGKGRPLDANTADEFLQSLKANQYFQESIDYYGKALNAWLNKDNQALLWAQNWHNNNPGKTIVNTSTWTPADDKAVANQESGKTKLPWYAWVAIAAGGIIVLRGISGN